MQQKHGR
jgi:tubulin polyglutamylase TTLL5